MNKKNIFGQPHQNGPADQFDPAHLTLEWIGDCMKIGFSALSAVTMSLFLYFRDNVGHWATHNPINCFSTWFVLDNINPIITQIKWRNRESNTLNSLSCGSRDIPLTEKNEYSISGGEQCDLVEVIFEVLLWVNSWLWLQHWEHWKFWMFPFGLTRAAEGGASTACFLSSPSQQTLSGAHTTASDEM